MFIVTFGAGEGFVFAKPLKRGAGDGGRKEARFTIGGTSLLFVVVVLSAGKGIATRGGVKRGEMVGEGGTGLCGLRRCLR
jgi:hypothetical protein